MSEQGNGSVEAGDIQVAVLVLAYLQGKGYRKTASSFKRCAALSPVGSYPLASL
jgi:hypothetical protein